MLEENNIDGLRKLVRWADFQNEEWWHPSYGEPRTIKQIFAYYNSCKAEDVECIEDLSQQARTKIGRIRT